MFDIVAGIVRIYNPNSWITVPMTRIVAKLFHNVRENREHKGAVFGRVLQRCGALLSLFSLIFKAFLHIWTNILVFRMLALCIWMSTP